MELVETNSSCDNIARNVHPPQFSSLSPPPRVPLCLMSHPFTKGCNWRRSIGGWGQEQSDRDFRKVNAGSEKEMVLPPNTQLHVITIIQPWRMAYSILLWASLFHVSECGWRRWSIVNSDRDHVKQILGPSSEYLNFFLHELSPHTIIFFTFKLPLAVGNCVRYFSLFSDIL